MKEIEKHINKIYDRALRRLDKDQKKVEKEIEKKITKQTKKYKSIMKNKLLSQLYESCKKWKTLVLLGAMLLIGTGQMWADDLDFDGNSYIFIKNIKPDGWSWGKPFIQGASDEKDYLYVWGNNSANGYTSNATLVDGTACAENAIYAVKMPSGNYYGLKLARGNSINISSTWNATGNMYFSTGKNYLKKYGNSYEWDTYVPTSTASLSATSTSITTVQTSTLTPSLSSNETYNEIKSTSYEVTTNPGSAGTVTSGGVFSATAAGTYTVTATVTYNAKGFSGITETTTATKNITVAAGVDTYAVVGNGSSDFGTAWLGQTDWGTAMTYSLSGTPLSRTFTGCKKSTNDGNQYYNFRILKNSAYQDADNCDQANSNISLSKNGSNVKFNIRWKADVTISYTPATQKAAVNVDESSYIADNYYLQGSITGWADGSPGTFTKVGGSLAYIKMTNASANHQFKITNQNAGYEMEMDTSFRANALGDIEIGNNGTNMNIASSGTYYIVIKLPCAETGYRHKVYATETSPVCTTPTIAWSTAPEDGTAGGSMTATVTTNQTSPTITWNSSNTSAATVNSSGVISYVAAGSTRITASYTGDGSTYCSTTASVYKDITVSAPTYYTVTYGVDASGNGDLSATYTSGGSSIGASPATVLSGSGLTFTATPSQTYYEVEGFYSDAACTSSLQSGSSTTYTIASLTSDISVYVKFKLKNFTVTYNNMTGATNHVSNPDTYQYTTSTITLGDPTKTGYDFDGWFTDDGVWKNEVTSIPQYSTGDKVLYAKWTAKTYTVNFNQGAGSGGSTSVTATFGSAMPDATMPTPVDDEYDFDGYYSEADGGGTQYYNADGSSARTWNIDVNNTTLYANYVPKATWYLYGDGFGGWSTGTDYPLDQRYRGIAGIYYREVVGESNNCFKIHDGTVVYGYPGEYDQIVTINGDAYTYTHTGTYYSFRRTIPEGTTAWFVINTNTSKIWIMSPLNTISVTSANGTVTMSATDDYTDQSITGTQFASGEAVTITVTPESGYQISSVTFGGTPIAGSPTVGYTKTYSVTMPSSDAELEVVYEEIPPEWKMYNGATLLGTFTGSGPYTAIINHTAGNSSNQYFELNGTAYQLAADCQLTSEQTLSTGSTQHAWTTDDYGYYRVSISTPDEGSTWKVQATRVYAVTYDGNGNTSGTAPATQYYAVGETIITATKGDLVYTNLHFYGWNTANDGSGIHYAESASAGTMTSSDLNLYAEWEDLSSSWVLKGGTNVTGDNWSTEHMLLKKPGHTDENVVYYTASISSTNAGNNESNAYSFKIVKKGDSETWYGLGSGDGEWWYYRSSGEQTMGTSNKNIQIIADMAGDYEVKVDYTDVSNPKVTVSFPIDGNYNVTLSAGSHGSVANEGTLTIHEFPKVAISATPEPGYRFTGWTVDDDHSSYINFDNSSNASTNVWATDAAAAGATITANFSNDGFVYLDKSAIKDEWGGTPYVYFYSSSYWDSSDAKRGSGSKTGGGVTVYGPYAMTRIGDSQIWYYDYHTTPGTGTTKNYIAFNDHSQAGYDNFVACLAIYRGDFYQKQNMFVVKDYKYYYNTGAKEGQAVYYNDGYWRKYNDIDPGYVVKIYNDWSSSGKANLLGTYAFSSLVAGSASAEATVSLNAGTNYFKVVGCDTTTINGVDYAGTYYRDSRNGTMDTDNSDNWPLTDEGGSNTGVLATASGDYNFRLTLGNGTLYISVDFPLNVGDYRLVYNGKMQTTADSKKDHPSNYIRRLKQPTIASDTIRTDTISFFVDPSTADDDLTPEIRFQWCSGFSGYNALWRDTLPSAKIDLSGITEVGIYNFVITQTNTKTASTHAISGVKSAEPYTGNFYVRTNEAKGGWKSYANVIDNRMTYSDYSKSHSGYDYYNCHYIGTEKNVKFTIANDYNECITDTLYGDDFVDAGTQELPYQANVRFMYNSETNVIGRAYLNGSSDGATEYLKIASNPGRTSATSATKSERAEIVDKNGAIMLNNDTTFEDLGNWVYQIDLKALEGGRVKLTSDYRYGGVSHNQWFKGKDGDWSDANTEQIMGGDANEYHLLRVIYDFKTNHMLSAWLVDQNENITTTRSVNADVLILRTGHEDAKQITFGTGAELDDVDTIYSAIELRKSHILGSGSQASKEFYWVSFPYDVKISDIFGSVGNFNIDWAIQYYNGKKRAQNGFWSDSEPNWEFFMSNTETLKANEGYVLTLALRKFLKTGTGSKWDNGVDSLYLYFPSANKIGTILKKDTILKIDTVGYQCTIDRRTDKATPNIDKDRRVADSHWHCIGIPSFANSTRSTGSSWTTSEGENSSITDEDDIPNIEQWTSPSLLFLYSWDMTTNKLTPVTTSTYTFKAMHAYLVQYANDTIHWKAVSRPSKIVARQRMAVQSQEFRLEVRKNNVVEDQTFIHFSDEEGVTAGFEFGRDLSKEFNNNSANIYTFADYVPVAGNSMPLETEQTTVVPMGVKVAANGEYTIAMPEGTNGVGVILVDNVAGTRTNLGLEDYTINLSAGQYNGRFVLEVSPIMHTPTGIEEVAGEGAQGIGARKVLIDGVMYIVRDGKIFDARGNRVK